MRVCNRCSETALSRTSLGGADVNDTGIDGIKVFTYERNFIVKEIEVFSISLSINPFSFTIFECSEWIYALVDRCPSPVAPLDSFTVCTIP
jgi:hypothetical protein